MSDIKFSLEDLEGRTYRDLQQLAKSLGLPSNVKKIYLIQLIHAKKFRTPAEVEAIVHRVKLERRQMAQVRKRASKKKSFLQGAEISSTSNSLSPPIGHTPRRPGHIIMPCAEARHTVVKYPRQSLMRSTYIKKTYPPPKPASSDRVLRSFSLKPKQPNSLLSVFKNQNPMTLNEARMDILGQERTYPKTNVMATCMVRKHRPQIHSRSASLVEHLRGQLVPVTRMNSCPLPARRQRVLSGIYPIATQVTKETPKVNYEYIQSIGFRRSDGKLSHINALVQKAKIEPSRNIEMTIQDLINSNIESQTGNPVVPSLEYPNMSSVATVYYHKKIRAEQVNTQKRTIREDRCDEQLPKINEVFSKFSDVHRRDVTQPIYVQVSDESERILNYPTYVARSNNSTNMLESFYNFKNSFLVNQPLLQVATTTSTRCVYSTPVIASAVAHSSSVTDACNVSSNYQEVGSSATIPEMVEDALEIISQDGDYMERIGMDVRVQCILCSWAGPRFILEYHIRKDHASLVLRSDQSEWNISFPLGCILRSQFWTSRVVAYQSTLYVLSMKYEDLDCYVALSALSSDPTPKTGYMTVYNKLTGEPHNWTGEIQPLSPNLPYYTETSCLKLDISRLDLIPNSANLKLVNKELVVRSPNKVIVGRPDLDDIHVTVFVKIFGAV
ncbi:hypothetical protein ABMA27_009977 [Loxostege sticticalis]|uniref:SAP domain-containing protein n=1 Tax=Loxostege sticticalis TaxID=481309 RepID=A0ABR3H7E3_LOXSC